MTNKLIISNDSGDAEVLVCVRLSEPLILSDNEIGVCAECGGAIQFRPHAPRLKHVCVECAMPRMEAEAAKGDLQVTITSKTAAEVGLWRANAKGKG